MKLRKLKGLLYMCCICMMPLMGSAQETTNTGKTKVDTLSIAERLSIRTNMVDWTLLVPNIGIEFDIKNENWNRWAIGLSLRNNWQTHHTFKPGIVYNIRGARAEFRNYWRTRQISEQFPRHTGWLDRLFSCRRTHVKHPGVVWYRGAYVSYNDFSIKLSEKGYQGQAYVFGFTYGMVKPLYVFKNGNSLDLELGVSAGLAYARYDEYRHDRESNCYPVTKVGDPALVKQPILSDLRVGFVYRLGKYPVTKKYHWRYDVDEVYRDSCEARALALENLRRETHLRDSLTDDTRDYFWHVYDSAMVIKNHHTDSINKVKAALAAKNAQLLQAAKEKERQAKLDAKAAGKKQKEQAKDSIAAAQSGQPADSTAVVATGDAQTEQPSDSIAAPAAPTEQPADSTAVVATDAETEDAAQPAQEQENAEPATDEPAQESAEPAQEAAPEAAEEQPAAEEPAQEGAEPAQEAAPEAAEEQPATEEPAQESAEPAQEAAPEAESAAEEPAQESAEPAQEAAPEAAEEQPATEEPAQESAEPAQEASPEAVEEEQPAEESTSAEESTQDTNDEEEGKEADNEA